MIVKNVTLRNTIIDRGEAASVDNLIPQVGICYYYLTDYILLDEIVLSI